VIPHLPIRLLVPLSLALTALALTGCGLGSSGSGSSTVVLEGEEGRPDVSLPAGKPPSKLGVVDLEEGRGAIAKPGSQMSVRYFRIGYRHHEILEDHWSETPTSFMLGAGGVDPAWEEGLAGMRRGGRRELILPATMTFAKEPEIYVIEAISVGPPKPIPHFEPTESVAPTGSKPVLASSAARAPTRLGVRILKEGSGGRVHRGELLGVRFMDINFRTKQIQDFWQRKGESPPYHFVLGQGRVREGWEIALPGKKLGTRVELLLPSRLAYGDGARRYVIELIDREEVSSGRER
jgi:peptidylprolyl isomerase